MKFLMFPSGTGIFPDAIDHGQFHLLSTGEVWELPVAGGYIGTSFRTQTIEDLCFYGSASAYPRRVRGGWTSHPHGSVCADSIYPDWLDRFKLGLQMPECKAYSDTEAHVFFLPFNKISRWNADGLGTPSPTESVPLDDWVNDLFMCHLISKH